MSDLATPQPANDNRPAEFDAQLLQHRKGLHAYALRRYGDEAEDLVHDTLASALEHWQTFRPKGSMYAWLVHMLRGVKSNHDRAALRKKRIVQPHGVTASAATQEDAISCRMALAALPGRLAGMLAMHAAEYTLEDIGSRYGVTRERARQLVRKAANDVAAMATRADTRRALAA